MADEQGQKPGLHRLLCQPSRGLAGEFVQALCRRSDGQDVLDMRHMAAPAKNFPARVADFILGRA
jgi:hypothetical protein